MLEGTKNMKKFFDEHFQGNFSVHMNENEDEIEIHAHLHGFGKEDVSLRVTENTVEISAQKREKREEKTEGMFRSENRMNSAQRSFSLPVDVIPETADTKFENGILTLTIKKKSVGRKAKFE